MSLWFWGWLISAAAIAVVSAVGRDRASAPFAVGAACAAALEAAGLTPAVQWIAFATVSAVVFVAANRAWYRPRHVRGGSASDGERPSKTRRA